jgi:aspartate-semialdehyde dehydrogenase
LQPFEEDDMKVAVVGATGAVGQTTLKILEERKFPVTELRAFASERSVGKHVLFKGERIRVEQVGPGAFKGVDVALFSAGSAQSKEYAPQAVKAGAVVVDKSSAFRMDPTVPLVVPEINGHAVKGHRGIVACPNCTTIVTVMPLKPLHDAGRLRRVIATSFQAVSGAGVNGVEELRSQTLAWSRGEAITPRHFMHQIAFNVIPHIDKFGEAGYTGEELKLVNEVRKILELPDLGVSPTTVRVPVFTAHSIAVNAETEVKVSVERAREAFAGFPGLTLWDEPSENRYPMPVVVEGQDDCFVGRIREDLSLANGLNFWVVGDQLRKGAALNGIQIAELLIR